MSRRPYVRPLGSPAQTADALADEARRRFQRALNAGLRGPWEISHRFEVESGHAGGLEQELIRLGFLIQRAPRRDDRVLVTGKVYVEIRCADKPFVDMFDELLAVADRCSADYLGWDGHCHHPT